MIIAMGPQARTWYESISQEMPPEFRGVLEAKLIAVAAWCDRGCPYEALPEMRGAMQWIIADLTVDETQDPTIRRPLNELARECNREPFDPLLFRDAWRRLIGT